MAMTMFYMLNGMGVAFLMYVLVHFWSEGRRMKRDGEGYRMDPLHRDMPGVFVMMRPFPRSGRNSPGDRSVIPLETYQRETRGKQTVPRSEDSAEVVIMKRFSTR
jgi:hypothetical protein